MIPAPHDPKIYTPGRITRDSMNEQTLDPALHYKVVQTPDAVFIDFPDPEGVSRASVHIEWDAKLGKPVLRVWDGVNGAYDDPRFQEELTLDDHSADT